MTDPFEVSNETAVLNVLADVDVESLDKFTKVRVSQTLTLARALDAKPGDSQVAMQYGKALETLEERLGETKAANFYEVLRELSLCPHARAGVPRHGTDMNVCLASVVGLLAELGHDFTGREGLVQSSLLRLCGHKPPGYLEEWPSLQG